MKIRRHLALMATAVLVPVVLFSGLTLNAMLDAEREALLQGMQGTARATVMTVDREWSYADGMARALAVARSLTEGDFPVFDRQVRAATAGTRLHTALIDKDGRQIFNTVRPYGSTLAPPTAEARARATAVLAGSKAQISNLVPGPAPGQFVAALDMPVTLADGRRMLISQWFDIDHFAVAFADRSVPQSWLIGIFDGEGRIVLRNRGDPGYTGQLATEPLLAAITAGRPTILRTHSRDGTDLFTVLSRSPTSGWTVAIGVPVEVVEASARNAVLMSAAALMAALLCAIGAAYLFGKRLVQALDNAARATAALGKGEAPVLEPSPIDEVGKLEAALVEAGLTLRRNAAERDFLLADAREARTVAESQNRAKDDFLAMLGHELRNPLSAITSGLALMEYPGVSAETGARARLAIRRQCDLLVHIVDELLDASRVMTGKVSLSKQVLDLGAAARACMEAAAIRGAGSRHAVQAQIESVWIDADPTRLEQIINNLLDNAFKYTPDGGVVEVTVRAERGDALLEVRDSGVGIDSALLPKIFDVFTQGPATIDRAKGGLGIGLAVVRAMAVQHGGSVSVVSPGGGKGSTFSVRFPCAQHIESVPAPALWPTASAAQMRVLVTDDNEDARDLLVQVLEVSGYLTLQASDGAEALRIAAESSPAVAVIDIGLPDLSGYEVAMRLRANPATASIKLIALTGYGQEADRLRALESGFDVHMTKPADIARLLTEIASARDHGAAPHD